MPFDGDDMPVTPRIIFITGYGRSGSTVFARFLAQEGHCADIGELCYIWDRGLRGNQRCGCGHAFRQCPFWNAVFDAAFGGMAEFDHHAMMELQHSVDRLRHVPLLLFPVLQSRRFAARLAQYRAVMGQLLGAIATVSGRATIIDTSKGAVHGWVLCGVAGIDVDIVHLVRDARAVAHSWHRKKDRPEIAGGGAFMRRQPVVISVLYWLLHNSLAGMLMMGKKRATRITYEQFCQMPDAYIDMVSDGGARVMGDGADIDAQARNHTISGNPVRFDDGRVVIRPDAEWQQKLPIPARLVATVLGAPLLWRYGYFTRKNQSD